MSSPFDRKENVATYCDILYFFVFLILGKLLAILMAYRDLFFNAIFLQIINVSNFSLNFSQRHTLFL